MTSLEKYKAALSRGEEIINMGLCGFDEQSAKNFTNAYNRAMSVITKAESMTDETLDELWINLDDAANLLSVRDGDIKRRYNRMIVIGIDGMGNYDRKTDTPFFDELRSGGKALFTDRALSVFPSISAENWCAMLKGVGPEKHGYDNQKLTDIPAPDKSDYPSVFKFLRDKYPFAKLCSFVNWLPINSGAIENNIGVEKIRDDDAPLCDKIVKTLENSRPLFTFIAFDGADEAGHHGGYGSAEHLDTIKLMDERCRRIFKAAEKTGGLDDTLILIVTDHGGIGHGHGGNDDLEMLNSYIAVGKGLKAGRYDNAEFRTATVASVACAALGAAQSKDYDFTVPADYFV